MLRSFRLRFTAPLSVVAVVMLLSGALVAGDGTLDPGGTFFDDDGNVHEGNIEAIAAAGITRGCNPPANTLYCPGGSVTRGQMAAFLRRALELPASSVDAFEDDDGLVFEGDINAIAAAGITRGCNPPANTLYCPGGSVTRGQMAAFLRRALELPASSVDAFEDDDGLVFEGDVNAIAAAGITLGCNPPTNSKYCPAANVGRDQMASFLSRGLGLSPINPPPFTGFNSPVAAFAAFEDVPLLDDSSPYAGPSTPHSLAGIWTSDWVTDVLADAGVAEHLEDYGFVVVPNGYRLFHWVYDSAAYQGHPVFVTTDAAYNMWHLVFDKILRDMETNVLLPELESLVLGMLSAARTQTADLAATSLADHALRVEEWLEAAATLLELDVGPIGTRAQQEVDLVLQHSRVAESPTMGINQCATGGPTCISYALFKPRGHYTRTEELQRFFRTMSMLGQTPLPTGNVEEMRLAGLLIGLLVGDSDLEESWQLIYDPTAFLVGLADDYTPDEFQAVVDSQVPSGFTDPLVFADDATVTAIAGGLHDIRAIVIDAERSSVRFMGSRATLDAFVMDQLINPIVPGRHNVSAMDVAAVFGSDYALEIQSDAGADQYPEYLPQVTRLRRSVAARTSAQWAATVYDAWLYAIRAMFADHGGAYPDFMRSDAWAAKAHQTGLGSYAELKHDTILYVKPAFAEGDGPPPPPVPPRHWVEPDPVAFLRLAAAANLMGDGLEARGLLPSEYADLIDELVEILDRLARLAEDELAGLPISSTDNDWLGAIGPELEWIWLQTADLDEYGMPDELDEDAAIIADIVTTELGALEVATGRIDPILVLVPNDQGTFQVAVGGVYSYYEFWQDASNRLTDEEWRAMLTAGTEPDRPAWQDAMFAD